MDADNMPKSRAEAKEAGAKYYFTGEPCKHGHIAPRKTKGACLECLKLEWMLTTEKRKKMPKSEAAKAAGRRYYEKNREAVIARANARPKSEVGQYKKKYKEQNPDLYRALVSVRKRRHRQATPRWITPEQKLDIRKMYISAIELSRVTGERYVVDHIIPLSGENVCGLHVPWNLRVITQDENLKKSNKLVDPALGE